MTGPRGVWWTLLLAGAALLAVGFFFLGFLSEPSAVGRMRAALYVIGAGCAVVGVVAGLLSLWMLVRRRT